MCYFVNYQEQIRRKKGQDEIPPSGQYPSISSTLEKSFQLDQYLVCK